MPGGTPLATCTLAACWRVLLTYRYIPHFGNDVGDFLLGYVNRVFPVCIPAPPGVFEPDRYRTLVDMFSENDKSEIRHV